MKISIKNLEIFANHGVLKAETVLGQKFIVSAEMETFTIPNDDIDCTVNYASVCSFIEKYMSDNTFKLIESAAAGLSEALFLKYDSLISAKIKIKKPWAPIKMHAEYVSAETQRRWHKAYIAFGSNLGDRRKHIEDALERIGEDPHFRNMRVSSFINSKPYGNTNQNDFLNGCIGVETFFHPYELLKFLNRTEADGGRERTEHWGPRTIDLDILYYDDIVMYTERLTIPHKEIPLRDFVLEPLMELDPNFVHPVLGKTTAELFENLKNKPITDAK